MSSSVGCKFFFNELVWVQIGPNPTFFPPEVSGGLEGVKSLGLLMLLASQGAISAGGPRAQVRDMWGA